MVVHACYRTWSDLCEPLFKRNYTGEPICRQKVLMHRIKIDENNPESEYEQYLFDPKADLRDIPKYMETEHFGNGGNRSGNAAPKRFLVMTTLERPKTASEKDAAIRKCRLKDKHHEDGLVGSTKTVSATSVVPTCPPP